MSGALGNAVSSMIQSPDHRAIGASTAVFAALGIQAAYTWRTWHNQAYRGIRRWFPLIGGVVLLAFLGGPGERIDVVAHITGFVSGALFGALAGHLQVGKILKTSYQVIFGVASIVLILLAWSLALM